MEDVDEGFGSNESSVSNGETTTSLHDLKHLNSGITMADDALCGFKDKELLTSENGRRSYNSLDTNNKLAHGHLAGGTEVSKPELDPQLSTDSAVCTDTVSNGDYGNENSSNISENKVSECNGSTDVIMTENGAGDAERITENDDETNSQDSHEVTVGNVVKTSTCLADHIKSCIKTNSPGAVSNKETIQCTDDSTSKSLIRTGLSFGQIGDMRRSLMGLQEKLSEKFKETTVKTEDMTQQKDDDEGNTETLGNGNTHPADESAIIEAELDADDILLKDDAEDGVTMVIGSENEDELLNEEADLRGNENIDKNTIETSEMGAKLVDNNSRTFDERNETKETGETIQQIIKKTEEDEKDTDLDQFSRVQKQMLKSFMETETSEQDVINISDCNSSDESINKTEVVTDANAGNVESNVKKEVSDEKNGDDGMDVDCTVGIVAPSKDSIANCSGTNMEIKHKQEDQKTSVVKEDEVEIIDSDEDNDEVEKEVTKESIPPVSAENVLSECREDKNEGTMATSITPSTNSISGNDLKLDIKLKDEDEEDDDVIFEGESKVDNKEEKMVHSGDNVTEQNKSNEIPSSDKNVMVDKVQNESLKPTTTEKDDDDDDDVIFEKEDKPIAKQSCDQSIKNAAKTVSSKSLDSAQKCENVLSSHTTDGNNDKAESLPPNLIETVNSVERKRPAESDSNDKVHQSSKRTKFDLNGIIGNLHSRVEKQKTMVHQEAEDNVTSIELSDSEAENDAENASESMVTDTASEVEDACANKSVNATKNSSKDPQNIDFPSLSKKDFEALVAERVKQHLAQEQSSVLSMLTQKVKELQQSSLNWRRQVKDLQAKVNDVTIIQHKHEKRKAATVALRNITTRHVGVQVEDGKPEAPSNIVHGYAHITIPHAVAIDSSSSLAKYINEEVTKLCFILETATIGRNLKSSSNASSPKGPGNTPSIMRTPPTPGGGTIRLPIPQSSIGKQPSPSMSQVATPTVKTLLGTTCVQRTVGSTAVTQTASTTAMISVVQYPAGYITPTTPNQPAVITVPANALPVATTPIVQTTVAKSVQNGNANNKQVLQSPTGSKVIDLTDDDDASKNRLVQLPPNMQLNPNVRQVLAQNLNQGGSQIIRGPGMAGPQYQLVLSAPSSNMRLTAPGAPLVQSAIPLASTQQTLITLNPASLTTGTSLARAAVPANPVVTSKPSHPAPFPLLPSHQKIVGSLQIPPKPTLKISRGGQGIVLSWNMVTTGGTYADVASYQLFAYQETSAQPVHSLWKKVGEVKALPLPMACTLTQFQVGNKYHFSVRALDVHSRVGHFSDPQSIHLTPDK